jgi:glycosyltransferase involved in cell wall biosynthesis
MLIDALARLAQEHSEFTADFYGSPLPIDETYYEGLKEKVRALGLAERVSFSPGVLNNHTPDLYRAHDIFVNTSPSGMFDKTLFEAAASGCLVLAASEDWRSVVGEEYFFTDSTSLAERLRFSMNTADVSGRAKQEAVAHAQSLEVLADRLRKEV